MELMRPMKLGGGQLVFGQGALRHLERLRGTRALIVVSGGRFRRAGVTDAIARHLAAAGMESSVYEDVARDPDFACVRRGAAEMARRQPDVIVALGGGSVLDAAKAMWVLYEHPEIETFAQLERCHNHVPPLHKKAYLVAIPTTSGTASEASRSMVITDVDTHRKVGVSDAQLVPDVAILEPELTYSLPAGLTAETGMDALTHALEALVSLRANFISDVFAEKAAALILASLADACAYPESYEARNAMQLGSYLAGLAFSNVSLGICHSIAHALGGEFGLPHGLLNAIALPYVLAFNREQPGAAEKFRALEHSLGLGPLSEEVRGLNQRLGVPALARLIDEAAFFEKLPALARTAQGDGCTKTNPRPTDEETMRRLMEQIYRG